MIVTLVSVIALMISAVWQRRARLDSLTSIGIGATQLIRLVFFYESGSVLIAGSAISVLAGLVGEGLIDGWLRQTGSPVSPGSSGCGRSRSPPGSRRRDVGHGRPDGVASFTSGVLGRATPKIQASTFEPCIRLLPSDLRMDERKLYLMLRTLDDHLVDDRDPCGEERVGAVESWARGEPAHTAETRILKDLSRRCSIPSSAVLEFCASMRHDIAGARIETDEQLEGYCQQAGARFVFAPLQDLPAGPYLGPVHLHLVIGPPDLLYRRRAGSRTIALGARRPRHGFPFALRVTFLDRSSAHVRAFVPCSHGPALSRSARRTLGSIARAAR